MIVYAITNQKGGVGKSTTAAALWAGLNQRGHKTLAIDLDAQCNLSYTAGADTTHKTALSLLTGENPAEDTIQHTATGDIIAASKSLAGADAFITETGKEYKLRESLEPLSGLYDYVIIDTPPQLGILTINALTACNRVIIPAQADIFSLQGIDELSQTIQPVKKYCNPALKLEGILLTRHNGRTALARDITAFTQQLAAKLGTKVFDTTIREGIAVKEAQLSQQPLFDYAPKANVTHDYQSFIDELTTGGTNK